MFEDISDDTQPYTMEELNARIDEAEVEIDYSDSSDIVHIADIWDTRREPNSLAKRI